jgi:glycosyltransferase involved in cell wall biosynthesis
MLRILQLSPAQPDFQTQRGIESLPLGLGDDFSTQTKTIGPGGDYPNFPSAALAMRRRNFFDSVDIIHVWRLCDLAAAAFAGAGRDISSQAKDVSYGKIASARLIFSLPAEFSLKNISRLRAITDWRAVQIICPTSTLRHVLIARGFSSERCHLIRPGIDFSRLRLRQNPQLRAELGFTDDQHILLAPGESTRSANHRQAVWAMALLNGLDPKYRLLLWGRGEQIDRVKRFSDTFLQPGLLTIAEEKLHRPIDFESLTGAADTALVTALDPAATWPICTAMAAGLPIVSTASHTVAELLEDHHSAFIAEKNTARAAAQRFLELQDDRTAQWKIAETARTEASEYYAQSIFLDRWRNVYQQIAQDKPVQLPGESSRAYGSRTTEATEAESPRVYGTASPE